MGLSQNLPNHSTVDLTELVGTQLFKQVAMAQVATHIRYCPALALAAGDRLIIPGQTLDKLYVLLRGRLQVFEGESDGKPIGYIHSGECVGLSAFIDRQPCHVTIVAEGACRLLVLDEEHMMALVNTPTVISRNLLSMLMKYVRDKATRTPEREAVFTPAVPAAPVTPASTPGHQHIDTVTGCYNRRWLDETLDRLILRAATDGAALSIMAIDIHNLAGLTEHYGQPAMDHALHEIAETVRQTVRPTDLIAHHGSGKLVVMLPVTDLENSNAAAARVQDAVMKMQITTVDSVDLPPIRLVTGCVQMKAFVASRKLIDDTFAELERNRTVVQATILAEAEAAAAMATAPTAEPEAAPATEPVSDSLESTAEAAVPSPDPETSPVADDTTTAEDVSILTSDVLVGAAPATEANAEASTDTAASDEPSPVPEAIPDDRSSQHAA